MNVREQKTALRKHMRSITQSLPESYLRRAGLRIAEVLAALALYERAGMIFAFASTPTEVDTTPVLTRILRDGKRLAVPRCVAPGVMIACEIHSLEELSPGAYGIPEPADGSRQVSPEEIQLAVIPCVCCDYSGRRLGHGGGYYDRFLGKYHGKTVLVCPEKLIADSVPTEPFDCTVPIVVTERGVYVDGALRESKSGG